MIKLNHIYNESNCDTLQRMDDAIVDCVITSPPYWQLRDYGVKGQWGLEPTYQEYLQNLWNMMDEIWRVLKDDGTVWINLGDSYGTFRGKSGGGADSFERKKVGHRFNTKKQIIDRLQKSTFEKCLMLIPHRFAIGCIDRGWILRNDIIWAKRNGMPESVTDRFTKKHEFIFFFVKQQKYYFNLDRVRDKHSTSSQNISIRKLTEIQNFGKTSMMNAGVAYNENGKNPGDVSDFWDIPTQPSGNKHFASYNTDLIKKPVLAGCKEGGLIYDPFMGTGTTACVALSAGRNYVGSELNQDYVRIAENRLQSLKDQMHLFDEAI